jgi:S-adenosylmethionine hydrolase
VTLLTDFGTSDYFVGSLKGVILSINPRVHLIDITHEIPPQDIQTGAFTLLVSYGVFPPRTTHLAVVDPGVGSSRRPILIAAANQFFIGPDNGLFSYIYDVEPEHEVFELTNDLYFRHPVSATFHGRDIFAPVAAAISDGIAPIELGRLVTDAVRLEPLRPKPAKGNKYLGRVIHIDHFGNCVTNISREFLPPEVENQSKITVRGMTIKSFRPFFSSNNRRRHDLFAVWGSAGFVEIAAYKQSAAKILGAKPGDIVTLQTD